MKFKKTYILSLVLITGGYFLAGCKKQSQQEYYITKIQKNIESNYQKTVVEVDTFYIDSAGAKKCVALGYFTPCTNKIVIRYFKPKDNSEKAKKFCEHHNALRDLIYLHEMAHAQKAAIIHSPENKSPYKRAQLAVMNEIMAPAAEIIGAIEYRQKHTTQHPQLGQKTSMADIAITKLNNNMLKGLNPFKRQEIADTIMHYATQKFLCGFKQGIYRNTIQKAPYCEKAYGIKYRDSINIIRPNFELDTNIWEAVWQFNTSFGRINIWTEASQESRDRLLETVDSVIQSANPGQYYHIKQITR